MKRTIVIYHGGCNDGFGAALAAWIGFGDNRDVEFLPARYGDKVPAVRDRDVYVLDFSYDRETVLRMREEARSLRLIDHHKTAAAELEGLGFNIDMSRSGAVLAWEHFHPGTVAPALLQYVQDRDLWQWRLPQSREVSAALSVLPHDFALWNEHLHDVSRLAADGAPMLRQRQALVEAMCDASTRIVPVNGWLVPVANASCCFSEVAEELCRRHSDAPFAAARFDRSDGVVQWSLRSRGGFDVSDVAKHFGGGGHAAAAGFQERDETSDFCAGFHRGSHDAYQDRCEGCITSSVGDDAALASGRITAPSYVPAAQVEAYMRGYASASRAMHGPDWHKPRPRDAAGGGA